MDKLAVNQLQLVVMDEIVMMGHDNVGRVMSVNDHLRLVVYDQALVSIQIGTQVVHHYLLLISQLLVFTVSQPMFLNFPVHFWKMINNAIWIQYLSDILCVW